MQGEDEGSSWGQLGGPRLKVLGEGREESGSPRAMGPSPGHLGSWVLVDFLWFKQHI